MAGLRGWALAGVLSGHFVLGFAWLVYFLAAVFFTSSYTGGTDLVLVLGCLCWLVALPIIVIGWRSGSHWYWAVPVAWAIVFASAAFVAVGQSVKDASSTESGPPPPRAACPKRSPRGRSARPRAAGASRGSSLIAFVSDRDGADQIYVMNANGSAQRRLTRNPAGSESPAWSPDGIRIAFTRPCSRGSGKYESDDEIFVMNADGSDPRRLTQRRSSDTSPAWSPDGTRIAFVSHRADSVQIYVMNANGSGQRVLVQRASVDGDPTWSPNGKQIAFVGIDDATICIVNSDGSGQRALTGVPDSDEPAWSPVANRITFRRRLSSEEIYTMNPDGSARRRLTHEDAAAPAWAPDGTKIVFASTRDGVTDEVYVMKADGSGQTRLTHNSATDTDPSWQPTLRHR